MPQVRGQGADRDREGILALVADRDHFFRRRNGCGRFCRGRWDRGRRDSRRRRGGGRWFRGGRLCRGGFCGRRRDRGRRFRGGWLCRRRDRRPSGLRSGAILQRFGRGLIGSGIVGREGRNQRSLVLGAGRKLDRFFQQAERQRPDTLRIERRRLGRSPGRFQIIVQGDGRLHPGHDFDHLVAHADFHVAFDDADRHISARLSLQVSSRT